MFLQYLSFLLLRNYILRHNGSTIVLKWTEIERVLEDQRLHRRLRRVQQTLAVPPACQEGRALGPGRQRSRSKGLKQVRLHMLDLNGLWAFIRTYLNVKKFNYILIHCFMFPCHYTMPAQKSCPIFMLYWLYTNGQDYLDNQYVLILTVISYCYIIYL